MEKQYEGMTDEQICVCAQADQEDAMDYLLEKYKSLVLKKSHTYYLMGGENEDLVQEGMIGLMKAIRSFEPHMNSSFASYAELCVSRQIYTAVKTAARNKHRPLNSYVSLYEPAEEGETDSVLLDTLYEEDAGPEELFLIKEAQQRLHGELYDHLSKYEKKVFDLFLEGYSSRQIAQALDKSEKSVDNAISRIKTKVRELE